MNVQFEPDHNLHTFAPKDLKSQMLNVEYMAFDSLCVSNLNNCSLVWGQGCRNDFFPAGATLRAS